MDIIGKAFVEDMTKMIIRPHRDIYTRQKLGPIKMIIKARQIGTSQGKKVSKYFEVTRRDTTIDCQGKKIQLSLFSIDNINNEPTISSGQKQQQHFTKSKKRCIVYLHANSGSRIEGLQLVKYILPLGWMMAIFDYRGSGLSDGQYTSMGLNESDDLQKIIQHLNLQEGISQFSLFGRSMGAVTILYYLTKQYFMNSIKLGITVQAVTLDSPFANIQKLMYQIGWSKTKLPEFILAPIVNSINQCVQRKIGVNLLRQLDLISNIKQVRESNPNLMKMLQNVAGLFLTSRQDKLVNSSHVEMLHENYPFQPRQLHYLNGAHNDPRSDAVKEKCALFLCNILPREKIDIHEFSSQKKQRIMSAIQSDNAAKRQTIDIDNSNKQAQFLTPFYKKSDNISNSSINNQKQLRGLNFQFSKHPKEILKKNKLNEYEMLSKSISPTIIINNNYNISLNLGSREIIPPIKFQNIQFKVANSGQTSHRNTSNNAAFFQTYTAKTEKTQLAHHLSNSPNITKFHPHHNLKMEREMHDKSYPSFTSIRDQHQMSKSPHFKQEQVFNPISLKGKNIAKFNQNNQKAQRQANPNLNNQGVEQKRMDMMKQGNQNNLQMKNERKVKAPEQQRQKISLLELRKIQKLEQEKCLMKVSKILPQRHQDIVNPNFNQLNNQQTIVYKEQCHQQLKKSSQVNLQVPQNSKNDHKLKVRSLKTSLMNKGIQNHKNIHLVNNMKDSYQNQTANDNKTLHSPKIIHHKYKQLNYKTRIDHL